MVDSVSTSQSMASERKHWWLTNRKIVDKYLTAARSLLATQEPSDVAAALGLVEAALGLSPRTEAALELKARCLLSLRRFRDVADMLQDYIPSYRLSSPDDDSDTSLSSSDSKERAKLLPSGNDRSSSSSSSSGCFSVSDLKRKVMAGLCRNSNQEGQWRYLVLGQACFHLGMMEDAMVLLQTGRRLAAAEFRRESVGFSDDTFTSSSSSSSSQVLTHIKLLLRRRAAAIAALDAGIPTEAIRHFTKILDCRRGTPDAFGVHCLIRRAAAHRSSGRIAEAIADCNRALALDPASILALRTRADLLESIRAFPDCLRDLEYLKLLYDSILRDRKLQGPPWRQHHELRYRDVAGCHRVLVKRIQEIQARVAAGSGGVDYFALIGVRRGCARSELERAHLLLCLRHKPERAAGFVDRMEFADERLDLDAVRDQARMSALILYRMLQKGYSSIMMAVMDEEAAEKQRAREVVAAAALQVEEKMKMEMELEKMKMEMELEKMNSKDCGAEKAVAAAAAAFQGVFCRDLAAVGSLISQAGFGRGMIPVKYEALSC